MTDDIWGPHYSEIHVKLKPLSGEDAEAAEAEIRAILEKVSRRLLCHTAVSGRAQSRRSSRESRRRWSSRYSETISTSSIERRVR